MDPGSAPRFHIDKDLLDESSLLSQLEQPELDALMAHASLRSPRARQEICRKGDAGHELFIIQSGKLKVCSTSPEGKEVIHALLEAGEVFGEMSLIDGQPRSANVTAVEDSTLVVIHQRDFLPVLERNPRLCLSLLVAVTRRLRIMDALVEDLRFLDLRARLGKKLVQLGLDYGRTTAGGGVRIDLMLSQEDLGNLVGASRENVNKQLRAWVDAGLLETGQNSIFIRNLEQFQADLAPGQV